MSPQAWRDRLGGWLRAGQADVVAPPDAPPPAVAATPSPAPTKVKKKGGVVAVTVIGLSGEALELVIETVERECATTGAKPVFVTDRHELEPFRRRKLLVDQVVDAEARLAAAPDLPWRLYRRRQFALMGARWRPQAVVAFGRRPDEDCLAELRGGG